MTAGPRIEGFEPDGEFGTMRAPFTDMLGLEWDLLSPERVEAHVDVGVHHQQPYGIVHGGVYASIVETLASVGAAINVLDSGKAIVGVHNSTNFLRPVRSGRLAAVGTPVHAGRIQQLWQVVITREDDKVAARGEVRLQVLDRDQLRGGPA